MEAVKEQAIRTYTKGTGGDEEAFKLRSEQ